MSHADLIRLEDEHVLVIRKPCGINTHSASWWGGEGIYDWLRRREPRWADLAIVQRLDKETSGLMVFSKSRRANVSLTKQFSLRRVCKGYEFLSDRRPPTGSMEMRSWIRKGVGRFESSHRDGDGLEATTRFVVLGREGPWWRVRAEPLSGRTHQIRLHAADLRIPILGDVLYGGAPHPRLCLHASTLQFRHPASNEELTFADEARFEEDACLAIRRAVIDPEVTDAYRVIHGAADGRPGWYVDRLGSLLLASSEAEVGEVPAWLADLARDLSCRAIYRKRWERQVRGKTPLEASPVLVMGEAAGGEFAVRENGLRFLLSLEEGYSTGLFLDQRDNRRRLVVNWVGPGFPVRESGMAGAKLLNAFAYTCGFSVAAAVAGADTTSLDLSRKYLDWGRRNLTANGVDPAGHDFIYGDASEWMRRLARKGRTFEVVIADPPTFSQSKEGGVFRAETDLPMLAEASARLVSEGGVLLMSTNAARMEAGQFVAMCRAGVLKGGRRVVQELFVPQAPDHPTRREEPGYLKTLWLRLARR